MTFDGSRQTQALAQLAARGRRCAAVLLLLLGLLLAVSPAVAQSEEFQNLELLSQALSRSEMSELMKGWSRALGVDCEFCHVGSEAEGFDYADDSKKHKLQAREMLRMTRAINGEYLPDFGGYGIEVNCATCHRGRPSPAELDERLATTLEASGIEAAVAEYRELRDEHFGGPAYDFRVGTLNRLAQDLVKGDQLDAAVAMLELNRGYYPDAAGVHFLLGEVHRKRGDKDAARTSYRKTLELDPQNAAARIRLKGLE